MARFTAYGKKMAEPVPPDPTGLGGASAHAAACSHDSGIRVLLTGHDRHGRRFRREARSVYGAFMTMEACWGLERAWHIRPDGSRRLLLARSS